MGLLGCSYNQAQKDRGWECSKKAHQVLVGSDSGEGEEEGHMGEEVGTRTMDRKVLDEPR